MFTLRQDKKILKRNMLIYVGVTLFVALLGFIYELNAHGVFSMFMAFAFVIPLVLGVIPYLLLYKFNENKHPSEFTSDLYNAGVATLIAASLFRGVVEIYGTTRELHLFVLTCSAFVLLGCGIISYVVTMILVKEK